ncbi:MAG TPA: hypothetical protein VNN77_16165 [candidate division Zixibacteria bacterium]|nr:hypothetical protein [candidate division Zixibacteria bacterium]
MEKIDLIGRQPRRRFFASFLAAITGGTAFLLSWKKGRALAKAPEPPDSGPILYRRTEEAERYYRTLYR